MILMSVFAVAAVIKCLKESYITLTASVVIYNNFKPITRNASVFCNLENRFIISTNHCALLLSPSAAAAVVVALTLA